MIHYNNYDSKLIFFVYYVYPCLPHTLYSGRLSIPAQDSGDGSLTISEVRVQDSSSYQCRASNTAGSINSNSVQLRVLGGFMQNNMIH